MSFGIARQAAVRPSRLWSAASSPTSTASRASSTASALASLARTRSRPATPIMTSNRSNRHNLVPIRSLGSSPSLSSEAPPGWAGSPKLYSEAQSAALKWAEAEGWDRESLVEIPVQWGEQDPFRHVNVRLFLISCLSTRAEMNYGAECDLPSVVRDRSHKLHLLPRPIRRSAPRQDPRRTRRR